MVAGSYAAMPTLSIAFSTYCLMLFFIVKSSHVQEIKYSGEKLNNWSVTKCVTWFDDEKEKY